MIEELQDLRGEDVFDIPLGTVLTDEDGRTQVFIGWRRNTTGCEAIFAGTYQRDMPLGPWTGGEPRIYHSSMAVTLLRKFPDLADYQR